MPQNNTSGRMTQAPAPIAVVALLSAIVTKGGHSLSWYTSKKARVWMTVKGTQPTTYTTSCEMSADSTQTEIDNAMLVLVVEHVRKMRLESPPLTTWLTRVTLEHLLTGSQAYAADLYARWQAGEMFWHPDEDLPGPIDDGEPA